jgi:cysteine desulfurase
VRTIYLDYNATTPLDAGVKEVMVSALDEGWGNPSSVHHLGQRARALLDDARDRVAATLMCKPSEIIFTSGGSESSNLALLGVARLLRDKGQHIITSRVEHSSVLRPCEYLANNEGFDVTFLPVDSVGRVSVDSVREALRPDTILVSIMAANNEVGTLQPFAEIGELCSDRGVLFHTDAVQYFGKLPVSNIADFRADLVSLCSHKFHGPKGAGLLFVKSPLLPHPIVHGAAHENSLRAGSENLPAILGLAEAVVRFVPSPPFQLDSIAPLANRLISGIDAIDGVSFVGDPNSSFRLLNTVAFSVFGSDSISLLAGLDLVGICASSGSACSSGSVNPSHVLLAMGLKKSASISLVRFSLGRSSSSAEIDAVLAALPDIIYRSLISPVPVNSP